jgi:hypothetical protein
VNGQREIARLIVARRGAYRRLWESAQEADPLRWNALREAAHAAAEAEHKAVVGISYAERVELEALADAMEAESEV